MLKTLKNFNFASLPNAFTLTQNRLFVFFTALTVSVNVLGYVLYAHHTDVLRSQQWVSHSYEVTRHSQEALVHLYAMNSNHKNYMLTGKPEAQEKFIKAKRDIDVQAAMLKRLVVDNIDQTLHIKNISKLLDSIYTDMRLQASRRSANLSAIQSVVAKNQTTVDLIRTELEVFISNEDKLLRERTQTTSTKQEDFLRILILSSAISIGGLLITIIAITAVRARQQEAERSLAETQEQLTLAMQGLNDGIFDFNMQRGTVYFSPRYKEMLGYKGDEFPDSIETFREHIHPEDREEALRIKEAFYERKTHNYVNVFRMRHKDGCYRWIMSRGQGVWGLDGKIQRLVGAHTDITEQKLVEENLRHSKEELENFTYIASHDLRSPLVNLKGFSSEMSASLNDVLPAVERVAHHMPEHERNIVLEGLTKDIPEALHYIQTAVGKMDKLTSAILDLQRIGKRRLRFEPVDTRELAQRCVDVLAHEIQTKGITVEIGELPEVLTDAIALEQIMSNLLDNAVKYLDPARPGHIRVQGKRQHGDVLFEVKDNGRGIAEMEQEKVFEFFRRASNAGDIRGEGMGMAFVKSIVNRLGGRIWFQSTHGVGTTFYFTVNEETPHD